MNSKATQPKKTKKDTNHSLKETHRNTVLFDVKTLFWFEKFGSETKLSVWWVKLDHYCIVDQTYLESKQGNLEVTKLSSMLYVN